MESTAAIPPQVTHAASPGRQGTRKLRESCISCSRSKVKCDKEKPICARCVRRGLPCEYMVSRRTGRIRVIGVERPSTAQPPATATTTATKAAPSLCPTCHGTSAQQSPPPATPNTPPSTARPSPPNEPDIWSSILSPNATSSTEISSLLNLNTNFEQLLASLSPTGPEDAGDVHSSLQGHGLDELSVTDTPSLIPDFEVPPLPPARAPSCCLAICLDALMRLFPNAAHGCSRPGVDSQAPKLLTIDSVIADNKATLTTVQTVLECRCAEDPYIATIVSLIVSKAMGWYVAVARGRPSSLGSCHQPASSWEEEVLHLPTVVGSYCIDGPHQSRMAAQLVLSELHRVQRLVTMLGRRLETLRNGSNGRRCTGSSSSSSVSSVVFDSGSEQLTMSAASTPATMPLSSNTLANLEDDLRKRLRAVSSETIEILRRA
ncbi:aflatoxin regulatory protein-domain-containing protein [Aspergillus karnatakaensis]|uniref:Zn(II)2Cys6 transcription factor n=1 Tax=Aspergillus karnatakaensis TaxID=1810916 RepID=UPI003CCDB149